MIYSGRFKKDGNNKVLATSESRTILAPAIRSMSSPANDLLNSDQIGALNSDASIGNKLFLNSAE